MVPFKTLAILVLIIFFGYGLRLYRLDVSPPSLNWDEVSHGYNAYSLLTTGRDQWGQILPVINFRAYGDYPTALNLYLTVPIVYALGPTDLAARLPQVILGGLAIAAMFLTGFYYKRNWFTGLAAAGLMAIEPWTLFPSRAVFQSNGAVLLLCLAMAAYFRSQRRGKYFVISLFLLGLSMLAYHNTRVFVPLLAMGMLVINIKSKIKWGWLVVVGVAVVIILVPTSRFRSGWVGILNQGATAYLEQSRNQSSQSAFVTKLIYNRPVYFITQSALHYLDYFTPKYLFFSGGTQYQFSLPKNGVMYLVDLPFFYLGLVVSLTGSPFLWLWLLASPIPAAITADRYAVIRATTMIPAVYLITASGITWVVSKIGGVKSRVVIGILVVIYFLSLGRYLTNYLYKYPDEYSSSWQYGYKQVIDYVKARYDSFDQIIITKKYGESHEFILWYWPWSPRKYLSQNVVWDYHDNWYWINGFDKFVFVNDWELSDYINKLDTSRKYLIVSSPDNLVEKTKLTTVNFLDGKPAFIISSY